MDSQREKHMEEELEALRSESSPARTASLCLKA
jgi:hypothetical protein